MESKQMVFPPESKRQLISPAVEKRTWKSELQSMYNPDLFLNCSCHLHRIWVDSRSSLKIICIYRCKTTVGWALPPSRSMLSMLLVCREALEQLLSRPAHTPHNFPGTYPCVQPDTSQILKKKKLEMLTCWPSLAVASLVQSLAYLNYMFSENKPEFGVRRNKIEEAQKTPSSNFSGGDLHSVLVTLLLLL